MILGRDKVKIDLTQRFFQIYLENMDFLNQKIQKEYNLLDLELDKIEVDSSFKKIILDEVDKEIKYEKEKLDNLNKWIDDKILVILKSLKDDLITHVRTK